MLISKLIEDLQDIKQREGDIDVFTTGPHDDGIVRCTTVIEHVIKTGANYVGDVTRVWEVTTGNVSDARKAVVIYGCDDPY